MGVEARAKELLEMRVEDYLIRSEPNSSVCLLCAQHPGRHGWGHFMRMLTLKRALEAVGAKHEAIDAKHQAVDAKHQAVNAKQSNHSSSSANSANSAIALGGSGIPSVSSPSAISRNPKASRNSPTSPSLQVVFSTLARPQPQPRPRAGSPRSERSSIEEEVSLRKQTGLLDANERRVVLEFPTPQAILKWAREHKPNLIVLDTRERGMAILPHLVKMGVWIIVLDSRHSFAFAHAHILLSTLAEPTLSNVRQPSRYRSLPPEFAQLDLDMRPNFERLWEEWLPVSVREKTEDTDMAAQQENAQSQSRSKLKQKESPRGAKLKRGESLLNSLGKVSNKVSLARESRFVLYIGGISRRAYWKQAFKVMVTLLYLQWSKRFESKSKWSNESSRLHESRQDPCQAGQESFEPFECTIFVDDSAAAKPLWNEMLKAVTDDLFKWIPVDTHQAENEAKPVGATRKRLKKMPLRTRFSKRLPELAFRNILAESDIVLTHPGLTAQAALSLGCTLFLLAPTPYLAGIARGGGLAPFYTQGTQALMQVMRRLSRVRAPAKATGSSPENASKNTSENILDHARHILDAVRTSAANHSLVKQQDRGRGRALVKSQLEEVRNLAAGGIRTVGGKTGSIDNDPASSDSNPTSDNNLIGDNDSIDNNSDPIGGEWALPSLIDRMLTKSMRPPERVCPHCAGEELVCVRVPLNPSVGKNPSRIRFRNTLFCPACKRQRDERLSISLN